MVEATVEEDQVVKATVSAGCSDGGGSGGAAERRFWRAWPAAGVA